MKYYTRLREYKASNVILSIDKCYAYSYNWWKFLTKVNGLVVFNNASYSPSTSGHQSKVSSQISGKITIDLVLNHTMKGLDDLETALLDEVKCLKYINKTLLKKINSPRTQKAKNEKRKTGIESNNVKITEIENFIARIYSPLYKKMNGVK